MRVLLIWLATLAAGCVDGARMGGTFPFDDVDDDESTLGDGSRGSNGRASRNAGWAFEDRTATDDAAGVDDEGRGRTNARRNADAGGLGGLYLRHFSRSESGEQSVRAAFAAAQSEYCDWKRTPLASLRGEVCGKHYKVLGLRRTDPDIDRKIKRAYRSRSLILHPDKNNAVGAADAFKLVTDAYECLSDRSCKQRYDEGLHALEAGVAAWRSDARTQIRAQLGRVAGETHYYVSVFARNFYESKFDANFGLHDRCIKAANICLYLFLVSTSIWRSAGQIVLFDLPVGQALLAVTLAMRFRFLLAVHAASYALLLGNIELAKLRKQRHSKNSSRNLDEDAGDRPPWSWNTEL